MASPAPSPVAYRLSPYQEWLARRTDPRHQWVRGRLCCTGVGPGELRAAITQAAQAFDITRVALAPAPHRPVAEFHAYPLIRSSAEAGESPIGGLVADVLSVGDDVQLDLALCGTLCDTRTMDALLRGVAAVALGEHREYARPVENSFRYNLWQHELAERVPPPSAADRSHRPPMLFERVPQAVSDQPIHSLTWRRWTLTGEQRAAVGRHCDRSGTTSTAVWLGAWRAALSLFCDTRELTIETAVDDRRGPVPPDSSGQLMPWLSWTVSWPREADWTAMIAAAGQWLSDAQSRTLLWHPASYGDRAPDLAWHPLSQGLDERQGKRHVRADPALPDGLGAALLLAPEIGPAQDDVAAICLGCDPQRFDAAGAAAVFTATMQLIAGEPVRTRRRASTTTAPSASLWQMILTQATAVPDAPALRCGTETLSYRELVIAAKRLAHRLRAAGVGPDSRVGVLVEQSPVLVTSLLAVLVAGGAFVPLEPDLPPARIELMLTAASCEIVIAGEDHTWRLPPHTKIVSPYGINEGSDADARDEAGSPADLAYIMFTSGSTGAPKAVMLTRQGLDNYVAWAGRTYPYRVGRGVVTHAPPTFDLSITSMLVPLTVGQCVHIVDSTTALERLPGVLRAIGDVTLLKLTPAHLTLLTQMASCMPETRIRCVVVGGAQLNSAAVEAWLELQPDCVVFNEYGPTETVVGCTAWRVAKSERLPVVPIGVPGDGVAAYVLSENGSLVPDGVPGELYVGGMGVARGYAGRPRETAESFVPEPWGRPGARMYRTGDVAGWLPGRGLRFVGRRDRQIELHGFRIEPAEIEASLCRRPDIQAALVNAVSTPSGDRLLTAFIQPAGLGTPDGADLARALQEELPRHLVPKRFIPVSSIPLTPNGKVALDALLVAAKGGGPAVPGTCTPTEELVRSVWSEVLCMEIDDLDRTFFDYGGTSFSLVTVASRLQDRLGRDIPVVTIFEFPTVRMIARYLAARRQQAVHVAEPARDQLDRLARLRGRREV
jgi:amino acid adenylation domain-containing protein